MASRTCAACGWDVPLALGFCGHCGNAMAPTALAQITTNDAPVEAASPAPTPAATAQPAMAADAGRSAPVFPSPETASDPSGGQPRAASSSEGVSQNTVDVDVSFLPSGSRFGEQFASPDHLATAVQSAEDLAAARQMARRPAAPAPQAVPAPGLPPAMAPPGYSGYGGYPSVPGYPPAFPGGPPPDAAVSGVPAGPYPPAPAPGAIYPGPYQAIDPTVPASGPGPVPSPWAPATATPYPPVAYPPGTPHGAPPAAMWAANPYVPGQPPAMYPPPGGAYPQAPVRPSPVEASGELVLFGRGDGLLHTGEITGSLTGALLGANAAPPRKIPESRSRQTVIVVVVAMVVAAIAAIGVAMLFSSSVSELLKGVFGD